MSIESLAQAEERTQMLLSRLEQLEVAVSGYRSAERRLDESSEAQQEIVRHVDAAASEAREVIATIRSSGGPEIIARLNALETQIAETNQQTLKAKRSNTRLVIWIFLLLTLAVALSAVATAIIAGSVFGFFPTGK